MLLLLSVRLAATIRYYLQAFAPTNILLRRLRSRDGLKWAILTALVVPTYLFAATITTTVIADSGPGWLNLVVLTCIWNAFKFGSMTVFTPFEWLSARRRSVVPAARRTGSGSRPSLPSWFDSRPSNVSHPDADHTRPVNVARSTIQCRSAGSAGSVSSGARLGSPK